MEVNLKARQDSGNSTAAKNYLLLTQTDGAFCLGRFATGV